MIYKIFQTDNLKTTLLIRLMVGIVFLSEGLQKFLFPDTLGVGRFQKIGFPMAEYIANIVGFFEILCGVLILIGLLSRLASVPLTIIMIVALFTTKIHLIAEHGFWEMMHSSRTDWAMLLGSLFLFFSGSGYWSFDYNLTKQWNKKQNYQK